MFRTSLDIQNGGTIDKRLEMFKLHKLYQFYPILINVDPGGMCVWVGGGVGGGVNPFKIVLLHLFLF